MVEGDQGCARRHIRQKRRGKIQIHDRRILVGLIEGRVAADLLGRFGVLLAVNGPAEHRLRRHHGRPAEPACLCRELFHVAESRRPGHQGAHWLAIALHVHVDADRIARIKAERLDDIKPTGRVMKADRIGGQYLARR